MANDSYWSRNSTPSPTPMDPLDNASYWDTEQHANTVYSTGPSPAKIPTTSESLKDVISISEQVGGSSYRRGERGGEDRDREDSYSRDRDRNFSRGRGGNFSRGRDDNFSRGRDDNFSRGRDDNFSRGIDDNFPRDRGGNFPSGRGGDFSRGRGGPRQFGGREAEHTGHREGPNQVDIERERSRSDDRDGPQSRGGRGGRNERDPRGRRDMDSRKNDSKEKEIDPKRNTNQRSEEREKMSQKESTSKKSDTKVSVVKAEQSIQPTSSGDDTVKKSSSVNPSAESRDPRCRKRSAEGKFKTDIDSKRREPEPDRPDEINRGNIKLHRLVHESDYIWNLRERFLLRHCDDLPANMLECLSQVFINMECVGSTYPREVMERVRSLSNHMASELHEMREKNKIKITFVKSEEDESKPDTFKPDTSKPRPGRSGPDLRSRSSTKPKPIAFVKPNSSELKMEEPKVKVKPEVKPEVKVEEEEQEEEDVCEGEFAGDLGSDEEKEEESEQKVEAPESEEESETVESEDVKTEEPDSKNPTKPVSKWKQRRDARRKPTGPNSDKMAALEKNKKAFARNSCEEMVYDLAHALAKIENEKKCPKNPVEHLYMGASWAKQALEFRFDGDTRKGQTCFVLMSNIVLGMCTETNKKLAKRKAYEDALDRLKNKPYLRVTRVNPERQELEASDKPFAGQNAAQNVTQKFAILGRGEVAKRGMKTAPTRVTTREDFILVDYVSHDFKNAANVLQQSADFNKVPIKWQYEESGSQVTCKVMLDHEEFASYSANTKQLARLNAAEKAVEKLQNSNWTIKIKGQADTSTSGLSRDEVLGDLSKVSDAIPESNIGSKLLKKMGWTGGGVGKAGQGISEPIKAEITVVRREGFGLSAVKGLGRDFKTKVKMTLQEYCRSQRQDDMRFSPEFSNEERAIVHTEARKFGLRSKSYGKDEDRYLVVGRKRSAGQLLTHIMAQGGSTSKYELVAPGGGQ